MPDEPTAADIARMKRTPPPSPRPTPTKPHWDAPESASERYMRLEGERAAANVASGQWTEREAREYLSGIFQRFQLAELQELEVGARVKGETARQAELSEEFLTKKSEILAQDTSYDAKASAIRNLVQEYWREVPGISTVGAQGIWTGQILESLTEEQRTMAVSMGQLERGTFAPMVGAGGGPTPYDVARQQRRIAPTEEPRFMPAFEEERLALTGAQPWRDWFESRYPTLLRRFKAMQPTELPPAEAQEKSWAEYLRAQKPKLREEWGAKTPWERGERPAIFAPRIKTVTF